MADSKDIDKLVQDGRLTPETAARLKQQLQDSEDEAKVSDAAHTIDTAQAVAEEETSRGLAMIGAEAPANPNFASKATALATQPVEGAQNLVPQQPQAMNPGLMPRDAAPAGLASGAPAGEPSIIDEIPATTEGSAAQPLSADSFIKPTEKEQATANDQLLKDVQDQDKGFFRQMKAQRKAAEAGVAQAQQEAVLAEERVKSSDELRELELNKQAEEQERFLEAQDRLEDLRVDFLEAEKNKDPQRFVKNMNLGQSILAFISIALGGASGGPNQALSLWQKRVENDIKQQESEAAAIDKDIGIQENLITRLRQQFKDNQAARTANRLLVTENFQNKLAATAAKFKSPQIQAKAQEMIGKLEIEKQKHEAQLKVALAKIQPSGVRFGPGQKPRNEKELDRFVPGHGLAINKKRAQEFTEALSSDHRARNAIKTLEEVNNAFGSDLNPKARAKAKVATAQLVAALRIPVVGSGQFSDQERQFLNEMIGNPAKIFGLDIIEMEKLKQLTKTLDAGLEKAQSLSGLKPTVPFTKEKEE